jgi:hypothetical protein
VQTTEPASKSASLTVLITRSGLAQKQGDSVPRNIIMSMPFHIFDIKVDHLVFVAKSEIT